MRQSRHIGLILLLTLFVVVKCGSVMLPRQTDMSSTCDVCSCYGTFVNCSSRGLTNLTMPTDIPISTTELDLSGNILGGLGDKLFMNLTNLQTLRLKKSSVTQLSIGTFDGLINLEFLDISNNEPLSLTNETTPEDLFKPLSKLKYLKMYGNVGTYDNARNYIDVQLAPLVNLETLWLDGFTENPFGKTYRTLPSLKIVQIASGDGIERWHRKEFCKISHMSEDFFENLIHVERLIINGCGLKEIHNSTFGQLQNIQYLDLSDNQHLNLTHAFQSMCRLSYFNNTSLKTLKLNNVGSFSRGKCGATLTVTMAQCLQNISLAELYLEYNKMIFVSFDAFLYLPKSLKTVSTVGNDFELGFYILQAFNLNNLTSLNISYQGYINEVSIWRKGARSTNYRVYTTMDGSDSDNDVDTDIKDQTTVEHFDEWNDDFMYIAERNEHSFRAANTDKHRDHATDTANNVIHDHRVCPQFNAAKYIPPGVITAFLPPLLETIDISNSRVSSPIFEAFIDESNSLKTIIASHSMLYCWDGPLHGLTKLKYLDLSRNYCSNVSLKIFEGLNNLKYLNIGYNFLGGSISKDTAGEILSPLVKLQVLIMPFNNIVKLPKAYFKSLANLEELNLCGNIMETFDAEIEHMTKLRYLNLEYNRIKTLSEYTTNMFDNIATRLNDNGRPGLCINLKRNSVHCYCNNIEFIQWSYQHYTTKCNNSLSVKLSKCHDESEAVTNLTTFDEVREVLYDLDETCRSYTALIACLCVILAMTVNVIMAVIVHRYRWRLQYWYFVVLKGHKCRRKRQGRESYFEISDDPTYLYDVFVASCDDQNEFIIDKLRVQSKRHALRTFLQAIDIRAGLNLADVIGNAIHISRVVLFVLSEGWCRDYEMLTAYQMWRQDRGSRSAPLAIGVKLGELHDDDLCRIREIHADVFLDYPGDENEHDQDAFWTTLVQTIKEHDTKTTSEHTIN